jgi:hypothetical protein
MAPGLLLTDIGAQPMLDCPDQLSRLLVPKAFTASHPTPPAALQLKQGEENNLARLTESFHLNLDALGFCPLWSACSSCTPPSAWRWSNVAGCCAPCVPAGSVRGC